MQTLIGDSSFEVRVLPETFVGAQSELVTGTVFVKVDSYNFPEATWNDFVVIVLGWWLGKVADLQAGTINTCRCRFMDGPFWFDIESLSSGLWKIRFIDDRRNEVCEAEGNFEPQSVIKNLLQATDSVIKECNERRWTSDDLETLIEKRKQLAQLSKKLQPVAV